MNDAFLNGDYGAGFSFFKLQVSLCFYKGKSSEYHSVNSSNVLGSSFLWLAIFLFDLFESNAARNYLTEMFER